MRRYQILDQTTAQTKTNCDLKLIFILPLQKNGILRYI